MYIPTTSSCGPYNPVQCLVSLLWWNEIASKHLSCFGCPVRFAFYLSISQRLAGIWHYALAFRWPPTFQDPRFLLQCQDQQLGIRNMVISDSTNCLLYRVSRFSIPSWLTCWVCERPAVLSDTFQRAEDLEATGVLTSSLQDKHVWTILSTNKLLILCGGTLYTW